MNSPALLFRDDSKKRCWFLMEETCFFNVSDGRGGLGLLLQEFENEDVILILDPFSYPISMTDFLLWDSHDVLNLRIGCRGLRLVLRCFCVSHVSTLHPWNLKIGLQICFWTISILV